MKSMPPIFIISLPEHKQRRARLAKQLNAMGLSYTMTDAVDGRQLDLDNIHPPLAMTEHQRLWGEDMSRPEIGCFLSHYNLWQHIADHSLPYALIMEDDIIIDKDLAAIVEMSLSSRWHWDIIRLSAFKVTKQLVQKGCTLDAVDKANKKTVFQLVSKKVSAMGNRFLVRYKRNVIDSASYMITQSAASKLIKNYSFISEPVDFMYDLSWQHGLYILGITPPVTRQLRQVQKKDEIEHSTLVLHREIRINANKNFYKNTILRAWYKAKKRARQRLWDLRNPLREK